MSNEEFSIPVNQIVHLPSVKDFVIGQSIYIKNDSDAPLIVMVNKKDSVTILRKEDSTFVCRPSSGKRKRKKVILLAKEKKDE